MNRRELLAGAAGFAVATRMPMLNAASAHAKDFPASAPLAGRPNFHRYQLTLQRVLHGSNPAYTPDFLLEDLRGTPGRRFTNFSGDLSGRWIGALSASSSAFDEHFPVLDDFVQKALALQHNEGYFGATFNAAHPGDDDMALLWGNGRLLVGLMEYYALRPVPEVLAAARRLGDFFLHIAPDFNSQSMADAFNAEHFASSYICWTQQTEGLAALYAATGDERYRDLCAAIASRIERRPGDHVHGYLCSVRGMLDLYFATSDKRYLDATVAAWNDVAHSGDLLITGGVPEAWSPKKMRTEGCAECDWLRLNLELYRATGEDVYLQAAEDVLFNDFSMNQFSTGDFGHAVLDEFGAPGAVRVRAWWCCTLHGLRAFSEIQRHAFRTRDAEVFFDLPLDATVKTSSVSLESRSFLATERKIRITVHRASQGHTLNVRQPAWAESVALSRNGRALQGLRIENLRAGDIIDATYPMSLRITSADNVLSTRGRSALHYGPWLLGASSREQPDYFNELQAENVLHPGSLRNKMADSGRFAVPVAATALAFTPAEYPQQKGEVELRAVAEQTMYDPARWATSFLIRTT